MFILAHPISGSVTSAVCGWSGTAPFCKGGCSSGKTRLPSNSQRCGTGSCCSSGSKALCCTLPSCPAGFEWARNPVGVGVDPCFLASQISEACAPASLQEILISNGNSYAPPTANDERPCTCSTPLYYLASACAFCQGGTYVDWKTWSAACTTVVISASGLTASVSGIPELPVWASFNVTNQPSFNPTIASDAAVGIVPPTSTSISTVTTTQTQTLSSSSVMTTQTLSSSTVMTTQTLSPSTTTTATPTPSRSSNPKHPTKSAIGGAVVGTIAAIVLLASIAYCLIRKNRPPARSSEQTQSPDSFRMGPMSLVKKTLSEVGGSFKDR